jgi:hypothetical protein
MKKKQQLAAMYVMNNLICFIMFISLIFLKHTELAIFAAILLIGTLLIRYSGNKDITAADLKRERQLVEVKSSEVLNPTEVIGAKIHALWDRFIAWMKE